MPKKNVGLLGCGTIGTQLALAIESGNIANASLLGLFDIVNSNAKSLKSKLNSNTELYLDFDALINSSANIIIEANKDLMILSVGALADTTFLAELLDLPAVTNGHSRIYVPTGAIAGIDAIRSVRNVLDSLTLTTTKSPKALAGAPFLEKSRVNLDTVTKITAIYEGSAAEAVKLFPANVNVAAVLSLAGIGADKTKVRIVVDPQATTNQHEITATGSFGDIKITVNNVTTPGNPKTSFLAILSAIECLRSICDDSIRIGS